MIHGKFLKINQELHRIQQVYQDLRHQYPNDDVEPVRTFKKQMEKGGFESCICILCHTQQLRSYGDGNLGLKSHPIDWWSRGWHASGLAYPLCQLGIEW